ncbi:hypothetical protein ACWEF6_23465 [Amycolatopsis sp. NPDC004772]
MALATGNDGTTAPPAESSTARATDSPAGSMALATGSDGTATPPVESSATRPTESPAVSMTLATGNDGTPAPPAESSECPEDSIATGGTAVLSAGPSAA